MLCSDVGSSSDWMRAQCVEVSSGLLAKGKEFLEDWGGRIDLIVAIFSVLGEGRYVCMMPGRVSGCLGAI